jgi:hypothetical protein
MESENQDSASPELPPRIPKRLNMGEEFAKTISSELNSRLSSIRTSGNSATPSRISGIQYDAPPALPKRGDVKVSDENLDDYDIPGENDAPPIPPRKDASPPLPPRRGENVKLSDENLEDFDFPDDNALPPPVPPRGADVKVSDENLDDYDIPSESAPPPALPPRKDDSDDDVPPPVPARTYHRFEENEGASAKEAKQEIDTSDELKKMVQKLEKELKDKEETISNLKSENNRLCSEIKSLKDEKRSSDDKIKELKSENESLKSENNKLRSDNESIKEKNKQLKIDIESASKQAQAASPTKSPTKSVKSPSKVAPVIPPKPSRKTCESMIQSANSIPNDEYDFNGNNESTATPTNENEDETDTKDNSNSSSLNGSIELLPGTSSRPLVLPTKSCVRKRGNRLSSAITERKSSKRVTSTLMEEPSGLDIDSPVSASPMSDSRKTSDAPPPLPSRSSLSVDHSELKSRLEKMNRNTIDEDSENSKNETPSKIKEEEKEDDNDDNENKKEVEDNVDEEIKEKNDHEKEEIVKSPTSAGAEEGGAGEEEEAEEEPEVNPTLSRIHRIGIPSLIPEGGLSNIKLRSRRREDSHSAHQFERLDEESLKKWIFATVKKDEVDGNLFDILHDGQLLCDLINVIRPEKQIVAKKGKMRPWHIVNINAYLNGCVDLRIKTIFKAEDLYEGEGLDKIIDNLIELKFYADNKK